MFLPKAYNCHGPKFKGWPNYGFTFDRNYFMTKEIKPTPSKLDDESFEAGLDRLTKLVSSLESLELNLDEGLKAFEDAVALSQKLYEKLNAAESRLEKLTKGPDGLPLAKPLKLEDEPTLSSSEDDEEDEE
jgi:exodeoxyribonuclease VII small subunit